MCMTDYFDREYSLLTRIKVQQPVNTLNQQPSRCLDSLAICIQWPYLSSHSCNNYMHPGFYMPSRIRQCRRQETELENCRCWGIPPSASFATLLLLVCYVPSEGMGPLSFRAFQVFLCNEAQQSHLNLESNLNKGVHDPSQIPLKFQCSIPRENSWLVLLPLKIVRSNGCYVLNAFDYVIA